MHGCGAHFLRDRAMSAAEAQAIAVSVVSTVLIAWIAALIHRICQDIRLRWRRRLPLKILITRAYQRLTLPLRRRFATRILKKSAKKCATTSRMPKVKPPRPPRVSVVEGDLFLEGFGGMIEQCVVVGGPKPEGLATENTPDSDAGTSETSQWAAWLDRSEGRRKSQTSGQRFARSRRRSTT